MKRLASIAFLCCLATTAYAQQPATGFPPYGSFQNGQFDAMNLQNLNVHFEIPIVSSPGRGTDFRFGIVYDSLIWKRVSSGTTTSWVPATDAFLNPLWGWRNDYSLGTVSSQGQTRRCLSDPNPDNQFVERFYNWVYTEANGTAHAFRVDFTEFATVCNFSTDPRTGYASDASGYYLDATDPYNVIVWSPSGYKILADNFGSKLTDPNGNVISPINGTGGTLVWLDTPGHRTLQIDKNTANQIAYGVLDINGNYQTTTMKLQTYNVKTNFACFGVVEYSASVTLPYEIDLPNGLKYSLTYEDTPGSPGYTTGRLKQITLPTGGYYEYDYPATGNNGINCSDGTTMNLTRKLSDATNLASWQYIRSGSTTTATAPQMPYDAAASDIVYTFDGNAHETSRKIYQGSASSGTLLRTINTAWATNGTPASRTVILEDNLTQSKTETDFDTSGNLLELREYAWGNGAPGALVRRTTFTYTMIGFISNRVTQRVVSDGNAVVKSKTVISYDGTALSCVTGAAQHDDTNYGCSFTARGNLTSMTSYADPVGLTGAVTKNFAYDSLGSLRTADVDCCQQKQWTYSSATQYAYPDSVTSGPSGGPQLTTNATYNSSTGLLSSSTDENSKTTSFAYDTLRRLTGVTRPDGAQISYSYDDTNRIVTVASPLQGTSVTKQLTYSDGLGRPIKTVAADGGGISYSITETQYDPVGRGYRVSNPHNSTAQYWTETRFDGLGRVTKTILPDGQQTTYSYSGSQTTVTDPAGKQRKTDTDALGRLLTLYEPDVNSGNALTQTSSYGYTVLDALTSVNQGAQTRTYNYDGLGRLTSQTTPEGGTWSYGYNNFGLVTQRTDARGVITTYGYDTLNRLTSVSYNVAGSTGVPATPSVSFTYGTNAAQLNNGRLVTMTDGVGSEGYTYDQLGRVTQLQKVVNGTTYTLGYQYNPASELTQITYPSGRQVQPSYDAIGRLSQVASGGTNFTSGYAYNPAFQMTGMNYGNGVAASFGYSADRLQLT